MAEIKNLSSEKETYEEKEFIRQQRLGLVPSHAKNAGQIRVYNQSLYENILTKAKQHVS